MVCLGLILENLGTLVLIIVDECVEIGILAGLPVLEDVIDILHPVVSLIGIQGQVDDGSTLGDLG